MKKIDKTSRQKAIHTYGLEEYVRDSFTFTTRRLLALALINELEGLAYSEFKMRHLSRAVSKGVGTEFDGRVLRCVTDLLPGIGKVEAKAGGNLYKCEDKEGLGADEKKLQRFPEYLKETFSKYEVKRRQETKNFAWLDTKYKQKLERAIRDIDATYDLSTGEVDEIFGMLGINASEGTMSWYLR